MGVWKDPFSLPQATARQTRYAAAYGEKGKWTPQFRIENRSLRGKGLKQQILDGLVAGVKTEPSYALTATAAWTPAEGETPATVTATLTARRLIPLAGDPPPLKLLPLLVQKQAVTDVPVGENRGKILKDFYIVRVLGDAVELAKAQADGGAKVTLSVPSGVERDNLQLTVLLEHQAKMRTVESLTVPIPKPKQ